MLKSKIGNYSIIIDGTWCEISKFGYGVIEWGNTEDLNINAENILINFIVKDMKKVRNNYNLDEIKRFLSQFNKEELKKIRIAYVKNNKDVLSILAESGYTVESYIKYINAQ